MPMQSKVSTQLIDRAVSGNASRARVIASLGKRKAPTVNIAVPSLARFVQESWDELEPSTKLEWNWHMDAICDHIQEALLDWLKHKQDPSYIQRCQNLLINVPPGSAKSRITSVCTPAWFWLHEPSWRAIFISSNPRVALRDSVLCRDLIESDWYQSTFNPGWLLRADNNAKGSYWNTAGGVRTAIGFGSKITGARGDCLIIDDPHDAEEVSSDVKRLAVLERWINAIANRVNDLRSSTRIGIMQRLHQMDWGGHVLEKEGWERLCIRQEFEPGLEPTFLGWEDPRKAIGELMFPQRFTREVVATERRRLGSTGYAAQHQQNPSPSGGGMFKIRNWRLYANEPMGDRKILSVDAAFKASASSDYVVVGAVKQTRCVRQGYALGPIDIKTGEPKVIKVDEHQYIVPSRWRGKAGIVDTEAQIEAAAKQHPDAYTKLIEDKANGSAIIERMSRKFKGIEPYNPGSNSKKARAEAVVPIQERGDILLPGDAEFSAAMRAMGRDSMTIGEWWDINPPKHESSAEHVPCPPWVTEFIDEFSLFPNSENDDQVDFLTQAINWLEANTPAMTSTAQPAIARAMTPGRAAARRRR